MNIDILIEVKLGNAQTMLTAIKRLDTVPNSSIPPRRDFEKLRDDLQFEFRRFLQPERTTTGFRVNLVQAVRFVLFMVYGKTSFVGMAIDIWGDGFLRAKKDNVTRLVFRVLDLTDCANTKYSAQSASHAFTFAVYLGKDTRISMELNLGSCEIVGMTGWLYEQTRQLFRLGCKITCSGIYLFCKICSNQICSSSRVPLNAA